MVRCPGDPASADVEHARLILVDLDLPGSEVIFHSVRARTAAPMVVLVPTIEHPAVSTCVARGAAAWVSKTFSEARTLELLAKVLTTAAAAQAVGPAAASANGNAPQGEPGNTRMLPWELTPSM